MAKYDSLSAYLGDLPTSRREVTLSFTELERVLGVPLPPTARVDRPWWANTTVSNHGKRWLRAGWKVGSIDLKHQYVVFIRISTDPLARSREIGAPGARPPRIVQGGYQNLTTFLSGLPPGQRQIALYFAEIGAIIGQELPTVAFRDRPWWANTKGSPQGQGWLAATWEIQTIYLEAQIAVLRRVGENTVRAIPEYVRAVLNRSSRVRHPSAHTLCRWIRFCRSVGWFFEGCVLFERTALTLDFLDELERAEVEEDYAVCKRELNRYKMSEVLRSGQLSGLVHPPKEPR